MQIGGVQKVSLVDWPGRIAVALFAPGCNLDCFYCHNRHLLEQDGPRLLDADAFLDWLEGRQGLADGVVVSGGEPTLQAGLIDFIRTVKSMGFPVKLDTNGTRPEVLAHLIECELVDYVAMDVKASRATYDDICGAAVEETAIDASICLLRGGFVDYEFRTTCVPQLTEADMTDIARRIAGARLYALQQFRAHPCTECSSDPRLHDLPHDAAWFERVIEQIHGLVNLCITRGVEELAFASGQRSA